MIPSKTVKIVLSLFLVVFSFPGFADVLINAKDGLFNQTERFAAVAEMEKNLAKAFEKVCEDTFCEGDYSVIKHIALNCFINGDTAMVDSCHWDFAGSYAYADGHLIIKDAQVFQCVLKPEMNIMEFARQVNETSGKRMANPYKVLKTQINARGETIYDGLSDCL